MAMRWKLTKLWQYIFDRPSLDRDLDEELDEYLSGLIERKIREGQSPEAARREALIEMEGLTQLKDRVRDERPGSFTIGVVEDFIYAVRSLSRNPALLAAIVVTLGLGIGANTAVYSMVRTLLFQPPPYREPDRLVLLYANMVVGGLPRGTLAGPEVTDFQNAIRKLQNLAAIQPGSAALTGDGDPEQLVVGRITWNFFDVLGVGATRGRTFLKEDGQPSTSPPVVI